MIGPNGAANQPVSTWSTGSCLPDGGRVLSKAEISWVSHRTKSGASASDAFQIAATFGSMKVVETVQMALIARERLVYRMWRRADRPDTTRRWRCWRASAWPNRPNVLRRSGLWRRQAGRTCIALANRPNSSDGRTDRRHGRKERNKVDGADARTGPREQYRRVLFTEHSMDVVFGYADRLIVLARQADRRRRQNTVRENPRVRSVFRLRPRRGNELMGARSSAFPT